MKYLSTTLVLALGLLTALGCDNRTDPITLMDSGPPQVDAGMSCGDPLPGPTEATCAASTATCIQGCAQGDSACFQACLDADPNAMACIGCLNIAIIACSSRTDCMAEWAPVDCCISSMCAPDGSGPCIGDGEPCGTQFDTFDTCTANAQLSGCNGVGNVCFPAAGGFLPNLPRGFEPATLRGLRDALPPMSATWLSRR